MKKLSFSFVIFKISLLSSIFPITLSAISIEANQYLEQALAIMEEGSINRHIIDWQKLRENVYAKACDAQTPSDTYEAISLALTLLDDTHSFLLTPKQASDWEATADTGIEKIHSKLIDDDIGYISVPHCWSCDPEAMSQFALKIQDALQALDQQSLNCWIIDLRDNVGGNMAPMLVGVSSLLDTKTVGYFGNETEITNSWIVEDGVMNLGEYEWLNVKREIYRLKNPSPFIAILLSNRTGSSGEATSIAFLGQKNVCTFGTKTAGLTSANEYIKLSDGAAILLATTFELDRFKRLYRSGITPDIEIFDEEVVLPAAVKWLRSVS